MRLLARSEQFLAFLKRNKIIFKRILGITLLILVLILAGAIWLPGITFSRVIIGLITLIVSIAISWTIAWCFTD